MATRERDVYVVLRKLVVTALYEEFAGETRVVAVTFSQEEAEETEKWFKEQTYGENVKAHAWIECWVVEEEGENADG